MVPELVHGLLEAALQEGVARQTVSRHGAVEQPQLLVENLHLGESRVPRQQQSARFWSQQQVLTLFCSSSLTLTLRSWRIFW